MRRPPGDGHAMPGQSMTSLAAATHRRASCYITISPWLGETEPNRLFVVFPLFMDQKKAWEKKQGSQTFLENSLILSAW